MQKIFLITFTVCAACSEKQEDTASNDSEQTSTDSAEPETDPEPEPEPEWNENSDYNVDATGTDWVYFSLSQSDIVEPIEPMDSSEWDLAFKRYQVAINGGISGTGPVQVLMQNGVYDDYESLSEPPEGEWMVDEEDANDDGEPEYAFQDWFDYDIGTHVLTPTDAVYFVQATDGNVYKIRFLDYYHPTYGESGYQSIEFDSL